MKESILKFFCRGSRGAPTHGSVSGEDLPPLKCRPTLISSTSTHKWKLVLSFAVNSLSIFHVDQKCQVYFLLVGLFFNGGRPEIPQWAHGSREQHPPLDVIALSNKRLERSFQETLASTPDFCVPLRGLHGVSNEAIIRLNAFALVGFGNLFCFLQPIALWTGAHRVWMVLFIMQYWSRLHLRRCENYSEAQKNTYLIAFPLQKANKNSNMSRFYLGNCISASLGKNGYFIFLCSFVNDDEIAF